MVERRVIAQHDDVICRGRGSLAKSQAFGPGNEAKVETELAVVKVES